MTVRPNGNEKGLTMATLTARHGGVLATLALLAALLVAKRWGREEHA